VRFMFAILWIALLSTSAIAQSQSADESAIRAQISRVDKGESGLSTADRIFWTGAIVRPTVGAEASVAVEGDLGIANRVAGSNVTKTTPVRIEVAKSGDMAYEFSNGELSYKLKSGQTVNTKTSTLRVWRKEGGQWKVAASFTRPHADQPGVANRTSPPAK